uniref:Uncharacterized protein n=1 Tax=Glossina pallidipes TaxID=7398 RepID=A0A1A9Z5W1_GLOPL
MDIYVSLFQRAPINAVLKHIYHESSFHIDHKRNQHYELSLFDMQKLVLFTVVSLGKHTSQSYKTPYGFRFAAISQTEFSMKILFSPQRWRITGDQYQFSFALT